MPAHRGAGERSPATVTSGPDVSPACRGGRRVGPQVQQYFSASAPHRTTCWPAGRRSRRSGVFVNALDLSRWQFGITTVYHFLFVPLTIGLAPLVAVMQTAWVR
ncbi:MAG TPA: cytochrome ubiquinol oxidase subunit I, partial [Kineosporiaceae bacterium]|nr:cytochrome ubiquinol oxidase subunit I [Kineosporiaceae bacterium]